MILSSNALKDLYSRLHSYVISQFPSAIINDKPDYLSAGYPGEMTRFILLEDEDAQMLIARCSVDLNEKLSEDNSIIYRISSLDELRTAEAAINMVMSLKRRKLKQFEVLKEIRDKNTQGYIVNSAGEVIGVVQLALIPTNAYITTADIQNASVKMQISEKEKNENRIYKARQGTLSRFYKR